MDPSSLVCALFMSRAMEYHISGLYYSFLQSIVFPNSGRIQIVSLNTVFLLMARYTCILHSNSFRNLVENSQWILLSFRIDVVQVKRMRKFYSVITNHELVKDNRLFHWHRVSLNRKYNFYPGSVVCQCPYSVSI